MSVSLNVTGSIELPISQRLSTTNQTDLLTGNNAVTKQMRAKLAAVAIVNEDSSARLVTLEYNDGSSDYKIWQKSMAANTAEFITDFPMPFKDSTWTLKGTAAAADVVTITVLLSSTPGQVR